MLPADVPLLVTEAPRIRPLKSSPVAVPPVYRLQELPRVRAGVEISIVTEPLWLPPCPGGANHPPPGPPPCPPLMERVMVNASTLLPEASLRMSVVPLESAPL